MRGLFKVLIRSLFKILGKSKELVKFVFTEAWEKETFQFVEYGNNETQPHIKKAILFIAQSNIKDTHILDIGAANGKTALKFHLAFPNLPVTMFEPLSSNRKVLEKIANAHDSINLITKAVGSQQEESEIFITDRITSSSILQPESDYFKDNDFTKETIQVTTLDHELRDHKENFVMKIDVQGYELEVLKGGVNALKQCYLVVVEVSNHDNYENGAKYYEVDEFLRDQGFKLHDISYGFKKNSKLMEWDALYTKVK